MSRPPLCFVVMPFRAELNYFYLYVQKHLTEKHGLRVERGDHHVLTKALERDGFRLNRRGFPNQEVSDSTCWLGRRLA